MDPKCVHHVEFGVQNGLKHVQKFLSQYRFRLAGTRITPGAKQWLVCSHAVRFLITELTKDIAAISHDPYVHPWAFPSNPVSKPQGDSVFNVALRVSNIEGCVNRLAKEKVQLVKPLQTISDECGSVRVCTIKSCVGNVVHTLVDDSKYSGLFLPGFDISEDSHHVFIDKNDKETSVPSSPSLNDLHHIDHVTFCTNCGSSASVISWYERCFGMKRFFINSNENEEEGFVIRGDDIGVRLKAFEYWKCAETGVSTADKANGSVKFVIAEALPEQGPNQVDMFLSNHGGPGVQHVGLHTGDIVGAISQLQGKGVQFNEAPYTYYTEVGRLKEMVAMGMNVDLLQKNGILVDTEHDEADQEKDTSVDGPVSQNNVRYLMQKFTRPLFDTDTFFLEVIQRVGATGFGSGNITALWRSVQAYFNEKGSEKSPTESSER
ncbi:4-hydroxyphenylpyruvate dioxygenase-like protein [Littorina saxatilis]|uniref:VOC domain-containing protein n=1 Tax=Littorina saxatilis TaxID=31220 RepID=A0AAN9BTJ7_9CAEN